MKAAQGSEEEGLQHITALLDDDGGDDDDDDDDDYDDDDLYIIGVVRPSVTKVIISATVAGEIYI